MNIFFDTEFIEDGCTIDLISIGLVREDGVTYYAESSEFDIYKADQWVKDNVYPSLRTIRKEVWDTIVSYVRVGAARPKERIAREIKEFVGSDPVFYAYYADYDWVALCRLYGRMLDLPEGWPKYCRDLKQISDELGAPKYPNPEGEHNALVDAKWNQQLYNYLKLYREIKTQEQEEFKNVR